MTFILVPAAREVLLKVKGWNGIRYILNGLKRWNDGIIIPQIIKRNIFILSAIPINLFAVIIRLGKLPNVNQQHLAYFPSTCCKMEKLNLFLKACPIHFMRWTAAITRWYSQNTTVYADWVPKYYA